MKHTGNRDSVMSAG